MEMRVFGRTGMRLSVLGFGCGAVGGLISRGDPLDQERTIARAIGADVNYFDTAVQYGNGESLSSSGAKQPGFPLLTQSGHWPNPAPDPSEAPF